MGRACLPELEALWLPSLRPDAARQTLLTSLGKLYVAGASINWDAVDSGQSRPARLPPHLSLPATALLGRYRAIAARHPQKPIHPSLHPPIPPPPPRKSPQPPPHGPLSTLKVTSAQTLPTTSRIIRSSERWCSRQRVFVEMLQHPLPNQSLALEAITFHQALVLDQPKTVQVLLLPQEDRPYRFEILSLTESDWVLHASGQVVATAFETTVDETTVLAQLQSRCRESVFGRSLLSATGRSGRHLWRSLPGDKKKLEREF